MGRSFAIGVACVAWLASATALAEPSWTFVGPVAQGRQFDAVRGPGDTVHLVSSRYYQLSSSGAVLVDEDQGDGRQGALDFPPAIAVGTDGSAHIVTRHGGNFDAGHDIRYRRRSASGQWDVDVTVGSPVKRNYVVGIAWTPSQVVLTSSEGGTNVWGDLHFWDVTASPQQLGSLGGIWRADCGARLRARGDQVWLATGQPDPDGFATVTFGTAGSGLVADITQNQKSHKAGTGRRGFPDIYLNGAGQSELVYGAEQTVFFNRYDAQGQAQLPSDQQIFSALGTWHMSLGLAAVAGSDDGKTVLAVALESDGSQQAADSALLWTFSADGGQSWSTPASLGKKTNGGEGRSLPRLVAIGQRFLLLWFDNGSAQIELATIDIDSGVLTDGGAGAGGGAGSGGVGASGGSGASGGASSSGGAGQVGGAGGTTTQGGTSEADDGGCGCRMVPASSSGWLGLALGGCLLALGRRLSWLLRGSTR